jgi:hypothetical protein
MLQLQRIQLMEDRWACHRYLQNSFWKTAGHIAETHASVIQTFFTILVKYIMDEKIINYILKYPTLYPRCIHIKN